MILKSAFLALTFSAGLCLGFTWNKAIVDTTPGTGSCSSLAVDGTGRPGISYYDSGAKKLNYAWKDGEGWHTAAVTVAGTDTGNYNSLAFDSSDHPRISFYDAAHKILCLAGRDTGDWTIQTVDSPGSDTGLFTALALDRSGLPSISYYNVTTKRLDFAFKDASSWYTQTVDGPGFDVGVYSSLALDAGGAPFISYYDATNKDLKFAWKNSLGSWQMATVDGAGGTDVGKFSSLALDSGGRASISFYDETNKALKLAVKSGSTWQIEIVDNDSGDIGWNTALVIDRNNYPRLCYLDTANQKLKFAWKDSAGWHKEVIGDSGLLPDACAMALDRSGKPHISFCNPGDNALAYLTVPNTAPTAANDAITTDEDTFVDIPVLDNDSDSDGDPLSVSSVTSAEHGTAGINSNGTVKYTPARDYNGQDRFSYTVTDGVASVTAQVNVTINPLNDPPSVRILSPVDGISFYSNEDITFVPEVSDVDNAVNKVEFYQGSTLLGVSEISPFTFLWSAPPVGEYSITAKAFDESGAVQTSQPISVTIKEKSGSPSDGIFYPKLGGCAPLALFSFALILTGFRLLFRQEG